MTKCITEKQIKHKVKPVSPTREHLLGKNDSDYDLTLLKRKNIKKNGSHFH